MLSSRIFWKLLLSCAGLNLAAAIIFGTIVSAWQKNQLVDQMDRRLHDAALLVRGQLANKITAGGSEELQQSVRQLGQEIGIRITLIALDGAVLADSEMASLADVAKMDNHRDRPEVIRAMVSGEAVSQRESITFKEMYSYLAVRADVDDKPVGIVRTSLTLAAIDQQTAAERRLVWTLAGGVFLCVSALSYWLVGRILAPVADISKAASAIAAGDYQQRIYVANRDELGSLAGTLNRMSQALDTRMTELTESHERQATVLGGMIEGVIAVDQRQRIVFVNAAAGRLFNFRPLAAEGRRLLEVVRNHELDAAVNAAVTTRQPQRLETIRDGTDKMSVAIQATPLAGNPCPGVVLVMHDTTELRRLESLRQDFVANVSHELKTPLSSIKAYAETLRNGALADKKAAVKFVEQIQEQTDRLHNLIVDMLSLARIESAQEVFNIEPVPVAAVVETCLAAQRPAAEAKRIELSAEAAHSPCSVRADREGLREILDNLVDNAIKYTAEGGRVVVRWQLLESEASIEVEDTGIGIREEDLLRIFERFYRVDKARSREMGGTGLGLAIVKHLAQSFGGGVTAKSQPGHGSIFAVLIPLA
ncbi:MAG TPA: ATP-binding protein [Lacipirellulaceae bacterium]|jgi:two-component system phosphate regulon sensor histidine kinase PhoR